MRICADRAANLSWRGEAEADAWSDGGGWTGEHCRGEERDDLCGGGRGDEPAVPAGVLPDPLRRHGMRVREGEGRERREVRGKKERERGADPGRSRGQALNE